MALPSREGPCGVGRQTAQQVRLFAQSALGHTVAPPQVQIQNDGEAACQRALPRVEKGSTPIGIECVCLRRYPDEEHTNIGVPSVGASVSGGNGRAEPLDSPESRGWLR